MESEILLSAPCIRFCFFIVKSFSFTKFQLKVGNKRVPFGLILSLKHLMIILGKFLFLNLEIMFKIFEFEILSSFLFQACLKFSKFYFKNNLFILLIKNLNYLSFNFDLFINISFNFSS